MILEISLAVAAFGVGVLGGMLTNKLLVKEYRKTAEAYRIAYVCLAQACREILSPSLFRKVSRKAKTDIEANYAKMDDK